MRKLIVSIVLGITFLIPSITKAQAFEQGKSQVSVGYGFINATQAIISSYDVMLYPGLEYSALGPVFLKYEYGVSEKVGFGLNIAYVSAGIDYDYLLETASIKWWNTSFNARVNRHFGSSDKFDPYIGLGLGYKMGNWKFEGGDESDDMKALIPLGFEATFGARYMFTPNVGIFSEVGVAKGVIQGGLNIKI